MAFSFLKKLRKAWAKKWKPSRSKGPTYFRPQLEALEERVVPATTRIWTGGSILSNDWSDQFNWQNGVPQAGDSVFFPANAKQRTNDQDIDHGGGFAPRIVLNNLHIEGGDYDIRGNEIDLGGTLSSDSGANTTRAPLVYPDGGTIDVGSGSLRLTGQVTGPTLNDLIKTGAGTLRVASLIGDDSFPTFFGQEFGTFVVRDGLVSLDSGGQLRVDLRVEDGGIVRLQQGGDQIHAPSSFNPLPRVTIDAGGVMDLNGHSEGLGILTVNGAITTGSAGTLVIEGDVTTTNSSGTAVISGRVDLGGTSSTSRTFTVANGSATDDLFIDAVIQGTARLVKDGPGRLTLTGTSANTYTGLTNVVAGVLNLAKSNNVEAIVGPLRIGGSSGSANAVRLLLAADEQISINSEVRVNLSGLLDLQGHTETLRGLTLGGNVTSGSAGLLKLSGDARILGVSRTPTISGNLSLGAARTFDVPVGAAITDLNINAVIVDGALIKDGAGAMMLSGSSANTYTGSTTVNEGTLLLAKTSSNAVIGSLVIGDGVGGADADRVVLQDSNQIADNAIVTVNASGLLEHSNNSEQIGGLTLVGGHVKTGNGLLTLNGSVNSQSAPSMATISGRLNLGNPVLRRSFNVDNSVSGTDLFVDAVIEGNKELFKSGDGTMELTANSPYSDTIVNGGTLLVNGTLVNSPVLIDATSASLTGGGAVNGIVAAAGRVRPGDGFGTLTSTSDVTLQSAARFEAQILPLAPDPHDVLKVQGIVNLGGATLAVQPTFLSSIPQPTPSVIDDSQSAFTFTSGFSNVFTSAGFGFLGDSIHFANPGDGSEIATWTFTNLPAGSYRVSHVAGTGNPGRATNAPFTIFNGTTQIASAIVNQNVVTKDFSRFGVDWDTLGIVQLTGTSNTLKVQLTNNANGFVFADAILLEPRQDVIIDNDGTDAIPDTFNNLPEGATVGAVATGVVNGQVQQQTQLYTISYKANDGNDVSLAYVTTATAAQDLLITPSTIHPGQQVTLTGHLTDPDQGDFLTLTIDWGDGKTETHHPGTELFAFDHRYAGNPPGRPQGTYTVHLTWFDQHNAGKSRDLTVTVQNRANGSDPNGDHLTQTAVMQPVSGNGKVTINDSTLTHTQLVYVNGTETFACTISDGHGGTATATVTIAVNLPASTGIDMLLDQVRHSRLDQGHQTSLTAKLNAAQQSLASGNTQAATGQLFAFGNEVRAVKRPHILADDVADLWMFEADNIRAEIGY